MKKYYRDKLFLFKKVRNAPNTGYQEIQTMGQICFVLLILKLMPKKSPGAIMTITRSDYNSARRLEVASNVWNYIKGNWKLIAWGLTPIAIMAIVFALPLKTVPVQTTETYWDTEMRSEPYTVSETYTDTEPYMATETHTETVYDSYVYPSSWSYTFKVDKADSTVSIKCHGYSYCCQPYFVIYSANVSPYYRFWPYDYWGGQARVNIEVSYPEEVTKYRTVTKYRDVTKYREVQTQVLKERTVTEYMKMPIWGYLFR